MKSKETGKEKLEKKKECEYSNERFFQRKGRKKLFFFKKLLDFLKSASILMVLLGRVCTGNGADVNGAGGEILAEQSVERHSSGTSDLRKTENIQNSEDAQKAGSGETADWKAEVFRLRKELQAKETELLRLKTERLNPSEDVETEVLRKELIETLKKSSSLLEKLKILELSAASVLDTLEPVYMTAREVELAETVELLLTTGSGLAAKSAALSEKVLELLPEMKLKDVEHAKLKVASEELWNAAGSFAKLNLPPGEPESFDSCRILAVDPAVGAVVLSAGYRNGVRVNLTLTAENGLETRLKVVTLRSFVCAAVVEEGSLKDLVPGMKVRARKR